MRALCLILCFPAAVLGSLTMYDQTGSIAVFVFGARLQGSRIRQSDAETQGNRLGRVEWKS